MVQPGVYAERNILKDGVNWYFNAVTLTSSAGAIIDNGPTGLNSDATCNISGDLSLINTGTDTGDLAIKLPRTNSSVTVTVHSVTTQALAVSAATGSVHAQTITSATQGVSLSGVAVCQCQHITAPIVFAIADTAQLCCADMVATGSAYAGSIGAGTGVPYLQGRLSATTAAKCLNIGTGASYGANLITTKALDSAAETALSYGAIQVL